VIDNVVWNDSWLSITGAGCDLTCFGAGEEQARKADAVRPPGMEQISRLGSRDPVASGVQYGQHGGKNSKTKSRTVSWLSLKTKVEPGLRGSRVMSGDWWRLHCVRGVSNCSQENHGVPWLIHKAKTEEQQHQASLAGGVNQSDRCDATFQMLRSGGHESGSQGLLRG
jgi:hypothetical protein